VKGTCWLKEGWKSPLVALGSSRMLALALSLESMAAYEWRAEAGLRSASATKSSLIVGVTPNPVVS
jgi:hypothetical protein